MTSELKKLSLLNYKDEDTDDPAKYDEVEEQDDTDEEDEEEADFDMGDEEEDAQ